MIKAKQIPVGISSFSKIRENNLYYIDKTRLIESLFEKGNAEVTLFTRPRRFGKTLAMNMLAEFFDVEKDSRKLFDGLEIMKNEEICTQWMNRYPVISLSFKSVDGLSFDSAYGLLTMIIADLYKLHSYLLDCGKTDEADKNVFRKIMLNQASVAEIKMSFLFLMRLLNNYYNKPVILLLDEYDVPIAKADAKGYYDQMIDVISVMLSAALKDNPYLQFAVITGCLQITKESIFTGANNFVTDTISDSRYNEYFGFTQKEIGQLLTDTGCEAYAGQIQTWYNGYLFGNLAIYCPWDVLNYIQKYLSTKDSVPENFWEHTSDNSVIRAFLDRTDFDISEKFEVLLNGGTICENIEEHLTYHTFTASEENLWSLLYFTGYLTKAELSTEKQMTYLKIPNAEVMDIFRKSVVEWFNDKTVRSDRSILFQAFWNENSEKLTDILSDLLFDTISYHDYAESYYHAFLTGLFSCAGYIVESNYENGLGRSDIVIKDRRRRTAAVIEIKIAHNSAHLENECQSALQQISDKSYAIKLEHDGYKKVLQYGIAFYKKQCLVKNNFV